MLPPIRREVIVEAAPDVAFALFTHHIGSWWPYAGHSLEGSAATVAFEGERLVERLGASEHTWAEVLEWSPPSRFELNWHPGRDAADATNVIVTFDAVPGGTRVSVVHDGWESLADGRYEGYGAGWEAVLGHYTHTFSDRDDRWFALIHRPGPAVPKGTLVFADPGFRDHLAFVESLAERGLLVAAGPFPDEPGAGMTIVRVGDPELNVDALARTSDAAVVAGVLSVEIRPWAVRFVG